MAVAHAGHLQRVRTLLPFNYNTMLLIFQHACTLPRGLVRHTWNPLICRSHVAASLGLPSTRPPQPPALVNTHFAYNASHPNPGPFCRSDLDCPMPTVT